MSNTLNRSIHCVTLSLAICAVCTIGVVGTGVVGSVSSAGSSLTAGKPTVNQLAAHTTVVQSTGANSGLQFDTETLLFLGILIFLVGFVVHALIVTYRQPLGLAERFLRSRVYLPGRLAARFRERRV
jgi:hypothetical protein